MTTESSSGSRLYYLDWLRVIAIICVFFFHNARFYDTFTDWHIKNATTNVGATALVAIMNPWMMPLFFLISGAGTYYALKNRTILQYIGERTLRILVPLIFGMLVIVVPQAYYQAAFHGEIPAGYNFLQILGLYYKTLPDLNFFHLWFLAFLFVFSIVTSPLLAAWGKQNWSIITRIAAYFEKPWALILLVVLPLAAADAFIPQSNILGDRGSGGWSMIAYLQFFIFGYLIFANSRIMASVKKIGWLALGAVLVTAGLLLTVFFDYLVNPADHFGSPGFIFAMTLEAVNSWAFLLAILALAAKVLNRNNRFLSYANEAVLPFYILHQTVIISIGYYIISQDWGVGLKYPVIAISSFVVILAIYELVRRVNVLRFLLGMRLVKKPQQS
jgi:glucans biosynthesis protein C